MQQEDKLDLILKKLDHIDSSDTSKTKLHELAKQYWGFTENDIRLFEVSKKISDKLAENHGKEIEVMQLAFDIAELVYRGDGKKSLLTISEK